MKHDKDSDLVGLPMATRSGLTPEVQTEGWGSRKRNAPNDIPTRDIAEVVADPSRR